MNKNPIIDTYVDGKFPHIQYESGSVGWKFIELDNLFDRIVDEVDLKVRRFNLIGSIHYHWLISNSFFEGTSFEDFVSNFRVDLAAKGGEPVEVDMDFELGYNSKTDEFKLSLMEGTYKVKSLNDSKLERTKEVIKEELGNNWKIED